MKKLIVMAALACCTVGIIQAQTAPGIKGGLNLADVSNFNGSNRVSGHVGLFLHHTIDSRWCIQPELLYSGQGQKYNTGEGERTLALSYVQVPVMIQYYPVKQLYFEFGPQLSFLTSAKVKGGSNDVEVDDSYRKADVGLGVGVGVAATRQIGFYARYNAGLTDITKNNNTTNMNRVGQLGMFVRLH